MPTISVVIPTFNAARSIERALRSIERQSWPDREIVIIDGASRDDTRAVIEKTGIPVAAFVSEPDKGIYDAINKGLALATGDLIGVLGSDDELCAGALASLGTAWQETRPDIIAGRAIMIAADGSESLRPDEDYGLGALLSGIPFCHNAMFATREAYRAVGPYDLRYRLCADANWVHRAIAGGRTCAQLEVPIVRFSLSGASSTNAELIMTETYAAILANFPELPKADAECLFRAIRGWSDGADVAQVLSRHGADQKLLLAAALAFAARARRAAAADHRPPAPPAPWKRTARRSLRGILDAVRRT